MSFVNLLAFAGAYLAVVILPGPGVAALVARVLAHGTRGIPAFIAGFAVGALCWLTVTAVGLAAVAASMAPLFAAIRYAGAAYLLFLAWKLWHAPVPAAELMEAAAPTPPPDRVRLFLTGLAINLGNPKAVVFFLALLPTVVDLQTLTPLGLGEMGAVIVLVVSSVFSAYALAATRARRLLRSPRAVRLVNRGGGMVMAGAAASIAAR